MATARPQPRSDTPETPEPPRAATGRRGQDVIERLHGRGRLTREQVIAAEEIERLWQGLTRGMFARSAFRAERMGTPGHHDPLDRLRPGEEIAWRNRYRPWAQEQAVTLLSRAGDSTRLQLVLDVVVDNVSLRALEDQHGLRHGSALPHLRAALHRYAEIAGWIDS